MSQDINGHLPEDRRLYLNGAFNTGEGIFVMNWTVISVGEGVEF